MKPRAFRLGRVLHIRKVELDRACVVLATAEGELRSAAAQYEAGAESARRAGSALARRLEAGLLAGEVCVAASAIESGQMAVRRAAERVSACESAVAEARGQLLAARTRLRALENLQSQRLEEARKYMEKVEQEELDEVALRQTLPEREDRPR